MSYHGGFRVDVRAQDGDLLAHSPIFTAASSHRVDAALREAERLVQRLERIGVTASARVAVVRFRVH
jgi:hypothetical protein